MLGQRATSQADYDKAAGHEAEAQAAIRGALGSVETARTNLDFTDIRSPIEGRVSRNFISEGNLVTADQTLLTTIVSEDPIHVYFNVDEKSVLRLKEAIRKGTFKSAREAKVPVQFALANEEGFPHEAIIDFVDNKIDTSMGSIQVRAVARNVERRFTPGFFVQVRLNTSMPFTGLLVPDRSIGTDQGRKFVYVVDDKDEVQKRLVTTGALHDKLRVVDRFENRPKFDAKGVPMLDSAGKQIEERVEILSPKDRVIFEGVQRVRPGMKVAPKETKQ